MAKGECYSGRTKGVRIALTLLLILGVVSIWFEDPTRLATALGLVAAGLSFALQKVITSAGRHTSSSCAGKHSRSAIGSLWEVCEAT